MLTMTLETDCILASLGLLDPKSAEPDDESALGRLQQWAQEGSVSLWASFSADEAVVIQRDLAVSVVPAATASTMA